LAVPQKPKRPTKKPSTSTPDLEEIKRQTERAIKEAGANVVFGMIDARGYPPPPDVTGNALVNLGRLLNDRGESDEASRLLERAAHLENHPLSSRAWDGLGQLLANQGELAAARDAFERALTLAEGDAIAEIQCNLGAVHLRQKDYDRAEELLRSAVRSRHEEAAVVASVYLAVALIRCQRTEEATATLAELMDLADTDAGRRTLNWLARYEGDSSAFQLPTELARAVLERL
jgi:tetratricopeptide (TPR) repeat protein